MIHQKYKHCAPELIYPDLLIDLATGPRVKTDIVQYVFPLTLANVV